MNPSDSAGTKLKEYNLVYLGNLKRELFTVHTIKGEWRLINKDFNLKISELQFDFFKV